MNKSTNKVRGVNLGGWLVLEKWMTPSLFDGLNATDETSWCAELGERASEKLKQHWNNFITKEDFAWLAKIGINAVRIPFGHWIFGENDYPYHPAYGAARYPFVKGGIEVLDR
ncbi:MAG TPA: glucan 1,3-beta-glucosidase, partial [Pseudomonadales bacterium]|nr:glucan 1,3-beta-glucosidase [Pseudomonadales bacterium]